MYDHTQSSQGNDLKGHHGGVREGRAGIGRDGRGSPRHKGHIVVVGQWRHGVGGRVPRAYVDAVTKAGGKGVVYSTFGPGRDQTGDGYEVSWGLDPEDTSPLDGAAALVLPGGGDIDPSWYGRSRHPKTANVNHRRDRFELNLIDVALNRDLPILAICHGMQLLNVHFGGTLQQHLPDSPGRVQHDNGYPVSAPVHGAKVDTKSPLADMLGGDRVPINSHHHQGLDDIGGPLKGCAWAEDGVLEGVVSSDHSFVVGVQWHPEVMVEDFRSQLSLFHALVEAAENYSGSEGVKATA
jgi:putative glutamine amidotransferase